MSHVEEEGSLHFASQLVILDDLSDIFSDKCRLLLDTHILDRLIQGADLLGSCLPTHLGFLDRSLHLREELGGP